MKRYILCVALIFMMLISFMDLKVYGEDDSGLMYQNSDFIEKEQPELSKETKELISAYQKNQSLDNYLKLRDEVIKNYNAVIERKEEKLAELIKET